MSSKFRFFRARAQRILPLWWLVLLIHAFVFGMSGKVFAANATYAFGFLSYDPEYLPIVRGWTLFVEETFYLLFPFVFPVLKSWKRALPIYLGFAVLAVVWKMKAGSWGIPTQNYFVYRFPLANLQYFAFGILLSQIYEWPKLREILDRNLPLNLALDIGALVGFVLIAYDYEPLRPSSFFREASFICLILASLSSRSLLSRFANTGILRWIGVRCYGVYLLNALMIPIIWRVGGMVLGSDFGSGLNDVSQAILLTVVAAALTFPVAAISWKYFEQPIYRWGRS